MRHKDWVLHRFPDAKAATTSFWPDGSRRHVTILAGNRRLELPHSNTDWWNDNEPQNAREAWHKAYLWCLANDEQRNMSDLFERR